MLSSVDLDQTIPAYRSDFLTYEPEFVLIFRGAGKFCLASTLRQLPHDVKRDDRILKDHVH